MQKEISSIFMLPQAAVDSYPAMSFRASAGEKAAKSFDDHLADQILHNNPKHVFFCSSPSIKCSSSESSTGGQLKLFTREYFNDILSFIVSFY